MSNVKKIVLPIGGIEIPLTVEDARRARAELDRQLEDVDMYDPSTSAGRKNLRYRDQQIQTRRIIAAHEAERAAAIAPLLRLIAERRLDFGFSR